MKSFVKSFDNLNMLVKLILTILFSPIVGGIYRIARGRIIVGIVWLLCGLFFIGWIADIVCVVLYNKYKLLV